MTCFIWVVFVHVVLFQGILEIAFVAEKELKPQINIQTSLGSVWALAISTVNSSHPVVKFADDIA